MRKNNFDSLRGRAMEVNGMNQCKIVGDGDDELQKTNEKTLQQA